MTSGGDERLLFKVLRLSKALENNGHVDVGTLALRALCLARLGEVDASRRDAEAALSLDPEHPYALSAATKSISACFLPKLLASPFAGQKARLRALEEMPENGVPSVHSCLFDTAVRATLVWSDGTEINVAGTTGQDHFEVLGKVKVQHASLVVADYILNRRDDAAREVTITFGGKAVTLDIPPKDAAPTAEQGVVQTCDAKAWVVVPVFNGAEALQDCLKSLVRDLKSTPDVDALVIDDASTDPAIAGILERAVRFPRLRMLRNVTNLGFVATVNKALAAIGPGSVLLLNSDTYLPPGTLSRLLCHLGEPDIATVTPLSNNAGSFSVPEANGAFAVPSKRQSDALARRAARLFGGQSVDVLNGNGFCMMIGGQARSAVGPLSTAYVRGYYEEVDFCLRASQKGFRHVAAVDCFVSHIGGVSFQTQKDSLVSRNQKELYRRFPFYPAAYRRYKVIDPLAPFRDALMARTGWQPVKGQHAAVRAPKLDFAKLARPLAMFDPALDHERVAALFPDWRLCPKSWANTFISEAHQALPEIREARGRFEVVDHDGRVRPRHGAPARGDESSFANEF